MVGVNYPRLSPGALPQRPETETFYFLYTIIVPLDIMTFVLYDDFTFITMKHSTIFAFLTCGTACCSAASVHAYSSERPVESAILCGMSVVGGIFAIRVAILEAALEVTTTLTERAVQSTSYLTTQLNKLSLHR